MKELKELVTAVSELDECTVMELIEQIIAEGKENIPLAISACQEGLEEVGEKFSNEEYFVGDLIYAGEMMNEALRVLKEAMGQEEADALAKVIFCTVEGDLHDIGKNIVKSMLEVAGFEVTDLGVDVPADRIVDVCKETDIKIILMSGVLTLSLDSMESVVKAFEAAGLRDQVKLLIGGNPVSEEACNKMGADAWAINPQDTINYCKQWAKEM